MVELSFRVCIFLQTTVVSGHAGCQYSGSLIERGMVGETGKQPDDDVAARAIVVADMLFASRVRGVADMLGVRTRVSRPAGVVAAVLASGARLVLVDLELGGGGGPAAIRALRSEPDLGGIEVVAFSSHMNTAALREGKEAGADRVLARSAFVERLPSLLGDNDPQDS
jgi:CheY-like chemotaxis protein